MTTDTEKRCSQCGSGRWLRLRNLYREESDHMCRVKRWVCSRCWEGMCDDSDGWPQGENGKFLPSRDCEAKT